MSYRVAILPERALLDLLTSVNRRIDALNHRIRWPGAVRFAENSSISLAGSTPDSPNFQNILSITLDPGVWVVDFASTFQMQGTAPSGEPPLVGYLRVSGREARWGVNSDGITPWEAPIANFVRVQLSSVTTLTLQGAVTTPSPAICSADAVDSYVIAQPV